MKDRPAVVVLATTVRDGLTEVVVAPVTTKSPLSAGDGVEMPAAVMAHLGLDDQRCWIITSEVNRFIWPGPDIRAVDRRGSSSPYFGKIPARLLEAIRNNMRNHIASGAFKATKRTE